MVRSIVVLWGGNTHLGSLSVQEGHLRAPWSWLDQYGEQGVVVARLEVMS
jgi:hypothetical protein